VRLLSVARLVPKKGIGIALRAFAAVCRDIDQLQYDIIGDGPLRSELTELARELAITDRVRFLGAQNNQSVQRAMLDADIFLAPSLTGPDGDEEGTPTVLIEASSSGLPVISTLHSGIPEVVLDGVSGYLVPEGDVSALASRIRYLIQNPDEWARLGHAGRRHVEDAFDIHALTRQLEAVYLSTLSQRARTQRTVAPR
jgi:colanic acid/amylovoran biosynthesis glycosyltransferase